MTLARHLWPEERRVAKPVERLCVSEWADRHIVLDAEYHAHPGPFRTAFTPYARAILDAWSDPLCRRVVVMGSTQWGKTMSATATLLWQIANKPRPILFVMASEKDVVSFASTRLASAMRLCEPVRSRMRDSKADNLREEVRFDGGMLRFAWPSPSRLSSMSAGGIWLDEIEKYPAFTGQEADAVSLARERMRWWPDAKEWLSSTPIMSGGPIDRAYAESDRRRYWVPCPHCDHFQTLRFDAERVQWPNEERDPERITRHRLAVYVCESCSRPIADEAETRRRMLARGVWVPDGGHVDAQGCAAGVELEAEVRGFHLNALYSPMLSWSQVAAEFIRSKDRAEKLQNFTNSWLGLPWQETDVEVKFDRLPLRAVDVPMGVVPDGTVALTAGADVQASAIYWTVRAHFAGGRSHTVEAGIAETLEDLSVLVLDRCWPTARELLERVAPTLRVMLLCIDAGYRTDEIHGFAMTHERTRPVKGEDGDPLPPITQIRTERTWQGKPVGSQLWKLKVGFFKDRLARRMNAPIGEGDSWSVHAEPSLEYLRHLASEHRAIVRNRRTGESSTRWQPRPGGGANHWWDAEVYAEAAGEMLHVYYLRTPEDAERLTHARTADLGRRQRVQEDGDRRRELVERMRAQRKERGGWIRRK